MICLILGGIRRIAARRLQQHVFGSCFSHRLLLRRTQIDHSLWHRLSHGVLTDRRAWTSLWPGYCRPLLELLLGCDRPYTALQSIVVDIRFYFQSGLWQVAQHISDIRYIVLPIGDISCDLFFSYISSHRGPIPIIQCPVVVVPGLYMPRSWVVRHWLVDYNRMDINVFWSCWWCYHNDVLVACWRRILLSGTWKYYMLDGMAIYFLLKIE